MDLTEEERQMILANRGEKQRRKAELLYRRDLLVTAARYEAWLQDNGRGSSFSTFVSEFGYDKEDASVTYNRVQEILEAANI
jgi:hypothetical protein